MSLQPDDLRSDDLRRWQAQHEDAAAIADLVPRQRGRCVGVVHKIRVDPGRGLELTVEDGSARLTATFDGRSHLPGVQLGGAVALSGTVAVEPSGQRRMRNPEWQHVTGPYD